MLYPVCMTQYTYYIHILRNKPLIFVVQRSKLSVARTVVRTICSMRLIQITTKSSFPSSMKILRLLTKTSWLVIFMEIIAAYSAKYSNLPGPI